MAARDRNYSMRKAGESNQTGGRLFGLIFGLAFFGMGALVCWLMGISPLLKSLGSKNWALTECVILSSEVGRHSSSDGTTYSIDIRFSYEFEGQRYVSDTYNFASGSSSGYNGKAKIISRFPVDSTHECWVNPNAPSKAVLNRDIPTIVYIIIPFSSVFMLIGLIAFAGALGLLPKKWKAFSSNRHKRVTTEASGSNTLEPQASGVSKLIGIFFFACIWNGITSIFVIQVVSGHIRGNPDWFLTIFILPFVIIGIGAILAIFYFALALQNPKLTLTLSESSPRLGDSVQLDWTADKSLRRLRALRIYFIGRESATYRRGTDSVTDHCTFHEDLILELDGPVTEQSGRLSLRVPLESMHSFDSGNNKIEWHLKVEGEISRFPDIIDLYPLTVRPFDGQT